MHHTLPPASVCLQIAAFKEYICTFTLGKLDDSKASIPVLLIAAVKEDKITARTSTGTSGSSSAGSCSMMKYHPKVLAAGTVSAKEVVGMSLLCRYTFAATIVTNSISVNKLLAAHDNSLPYSL